MKQRTSETERLRCQQINSETSEDPKRHFTDSKACFAVAETEELLTEKNDHYGNDTRVFNLTAQVINRWTTLRLYSTSSSSNYRNLDQRDRSGARLQAHQKRVSGQDDTFEEFIY